MTTRNSPLPLALAALLAACGGEPGAAGTAVVPDAISDLGETLPDGGAADLGVPDFPIVPCQEEGSVCDDGRACTQNDICLSGACVGAARDCSALSGQCFSGECVEPDGSCAAVPLADGLACNDGIFCTVGDQCQGLVCSGTWRDCSVLSGSCTRGICDEIGQSCVALPDNEAGLCDDGLFCTVADGCSRGLCLGVARDCSALANDCNAASCDEGIDTCVTAAINEAGPCEDGEFCTVADTCSSGVCIGGTARDCSAVANWCNTESCDDLGDLCAPVPANEGGFCDDGLVCTFGQSCASGACAGGGVFSCDDFNACTADACVEPLGCQFTPLGPFPGLEGPVGDPTCSDFIDNDCDLRFDLADGSCVAGDPGVACDVDVCFLPEVCCLGSGPPFMPFCTTFCPGPSASCDGGEDCPDSTCCVEVHVDVATGQVSSGTIQCAVSCPYTCDLFGGVLRSEPCDVPANCATQPSCCGDGTLDTGFCLDTFCADLLEASTTATCEP